MGQAATVQLYFQPGLRHGRKRVGWCQSVSGLYQDFVWVLPLGKLLQLCHSVAGPPGRFVKKKISRCSFLGGPRVTVDPQGVHDGAAARQAEKPERPACLSALVARLPRPRSHGVRRQQPWFAPTAVWHNGGAPVRRFRSPSVDWNEEVSNVPPSTLPNLLGCSVQFGRLTFPNYADKIWTTSSGFMRIAQTLRQ